ncbi:MAG: hypothetical protein LBC84_00630 [Prevotellaceae bacterium]|jgi:hypothetical protein|nr:hypothetical protein [Prevotellaceae bacterium]
MKKIIIITIFLVAGINLLAQDRSKSEGYYNLTQLSFLMGEVNEDAPTPVKQNMIPSVVNINGYRANEHFSIGLGIGMTPFSYTIFPVFADLRITLFDDHLSPVLALKAGYAFTNSKKDAWEYHSNDVTNRGGAMVNPEFGIKVSITERADFMLTIGYWYQHLKSEMKGAYPGYYDYGYDRTRTADINRLSLSLGFLFK